MSRKVQCVYCKKETLNTTAVPIKLKHSNMTCYCCEECEKYVRDDIDFYEALYMIVKIFSFTKWRVNKSVRTYLKNQLRSAEDTTLLKEVLVNNYQIITDIVEKKEFQNSMAMAKYIIAIVHNKYTYDKNIKELNALRNEQVKSDNDESVSKVKSSIKKRTNISKFLD